ncbi:hypothetical protein YC2023_075978 [Brassica napus]
MPPCRETSPKNIALGTTTLMMDNQASKRNYISHCMTEKLFPLHHFFFQILNPKATTLLHTTRQDKVSLTPVSNSAGEQKRFLNLTPFMSTAELNN